MRPALTGGRLLAAVSCLFVIVLVQGCISPSLLSPPSPPYSAAETKIILKQLTIQADLVKTLFCTGKLTSRRGESQQQVNIAIVGQQTPFQVKIEITHPWGSPVANLLIDESRFTLVFFPKKQIFTGPVRSGMGHRSFPFPLEPSAVWSFVRGYPAIPDYQWAVSPKKGVITLLDSKNDSIRRLDVSPSTHRPEACAFPALGITQYYDEVQKDGSVEFAQSVVLKETSHQRSLILRIRHALFNPTLPTGVFQMEKPENFTIVDLARETPVP